MKILVGNKTDRDDREIPIAIGEEFAKQQGMYFLETSAKEAENVERLFYEIAAELIEQARTKEVCCFGIEKRIFYRYSTDNNIIYIVILDQNRCPEAKLAAYQI